MKSFVIRWAINSVAMWVAVELLSGTHIFPQSSDLTGIIIMALIFGLVNAIIRPLVMVLSCPLIVLTLGWAPCWSIRACLPWLAGLVRRLDMDLK
jgi:putative membrane protein